MVGRCVYCGRYSEKHLNRSFHRFPSDVRLRNIWCQELGLNTLAKNAILCSDHFSSKDFVKKPSGVKYLRKEAVPTANKSKSLEHTQLHISTVEGTDTKGEKENVTGQTATKMLRPESLEKSSINSQLMENLYNLSPAVEIHIKSESGDEDVPTMECVEEQVAESIDTNEISSVDEISVHSYNSFEECVPTAAPIEEEIQYLSDSSTLSAWSEHCLEADDDVSEKAPSICSPAPIAPETYMECEEENEAPLDCEEENVTHLESEGGNVLKRKKKMRRYFGDCSEDDFYNPNRAHVSWHIARKTIADQKKKIIKIQTQNRKLKNRIASLNSLLKYLFLNYEFVKKS